MQRYMSAQKKKIEIEKWCEGERCQSDPGKEFVLWWILHYGSWFRQAWEKSLCRQCRLADQCGHRVRQECARFIPAD